MHEMLSTMRARLAGIIARRGQRRPGVVAPPPRSWPLTPDQVAHVEAVYEALHDSELFRSTPDDRARAIEAMEREGYGESVGALEAVLGLRFRSTDRDDAMPGWVFTAEQVECFDSTIALLASDLLELTGHRARPDDVAIHRDPSPANTGTVTVPVDGTPVTIACTFAAKHTPDGLVDGIARLAVGEDGRRLHWENLDMALAIVAATEAQVERFNRAMEALGDRFRFVPVLDPKP